MAVKLTLTIEKSVIEEAKEYAKSQGRSLSSLVEAYLKSVSRPLELDVEIKLSPIVESLYGAVDMSGRNLDYKELLKEEIFKKHLG